MEGPSIKNHLFCVILAGGGGTRLWPRSTTTKPKQFLRLVSDKTMLQETYDRITPIVPPERIFVITNERYRHLVHADLPELPRENVFAEPEKRDTAMAMGVGTMLVHRKDPDGIVINLAADHMVSHLKEFRATILAAASASRLGDYLITVGIRPTFPHTGMGYIKIGDRFKQLDGMNVFRVENFTEKPDIDHAKEFLSTGKYFWNANNYVWTVTAALLAFKKHLPETYRQFADLEKYLGKNTAEERIKKAYRAVKSISIDYGVSEKATNLLLIPGDFGWSDIGDWQEVYDLSKKDADGNVIDKSRNEPPVLLEVGGSLIQGGKKLLAVVGMTDMVIIETKRALLIVPRSKAQDVKHVVEEIKSKGLSEYL